MTKYFVTVQRGPVAVKTEQDFEQLPDFLSRGVDKSERFKVQFEKRQDAAFKYHVFERVIICG